MAVSYCRGCGKEIQGSLAACPLCGALQVANASAKVRNASLLAVASGYLLIPFFPLAAIAIGIRLLSSNKKSHGIAVTVMSLVVVFGVAIHQLVNLFR